MKPAKISLIGLNKEFQTRSQTILAVKDVNMHFEDGDFVSIVGPSGCGKSTVIRMIDDIIKPTSGQILIDGEDMTQYSRQPLHISRKMGFVFQQPNLYPWLTVKENVLLPLKILRIKDKRYFDYAEELIEMSGLKPYADTYPLEISGGSMPRAGVIRAMVSDPEILLMDEPFGALDEMTREELNIELLEIWKKTKKTIIFITHNVEEAVLLSNRIYVMGTNPGRVVDEVSITLARPRTLKMMEQQGFIDYCRQVSASIGHLDLEKIK